MFVDLFAVCPEGLSVEDWPRNDDEPVETSTATPSCTRIHGRVQRIIISPDSCEDRSDYSPRLLGEYSVCVSRFLSAIKNGAEKQRQSAAGRRLTEGRCSSE